MHVLMVPSRRTIVVPGRDVTASTVPNIVRACREEVRSEVAQWPLTFRTMPNGSLHVDIVLLPLRGLGTVLPFLDDVDAVHVHVDPTMEAGTVALVQRATAPGGNPLSVDLLRHMVAEERSASPPPPPPPPHAPPSSPC